MSSLTNATTPARQRARRAFTIAATLVFAVAPIVVSLVTIRILFGAGLERYVPASNDENNYWHQVVTFRDVGFQGGYYTVNEIAPRAPFTRFYVYGPWHPMFYGLIAALFGWGNASYILVNFVVWIIAALAAVWIARPSPQKLLLAIGVVAFWWPQVAFLTSTLVEALNGAAAMLMAALFYRMIAGTSRRRHAVALFALIVIVSLPRPTWAILLIPYAFLASGATSLRSRRLWVWLLGCACLAALLAVEYLTLGAPFPQPFHQLANDPNTRSINFIVQNTLTNLGYWAGFLRQIFRAQAWDAMQLTMRLQALAFLAGLAVVAVLGWRERRRGTLDVAITADVRASLTGLFNLAVIIAMSAVIFYSTLDYRTVANHLLMTALLTVFMLPDRFRAMLARRTAAIFLALTAFVIATNLLSIREFRVAAFNWSRGSFRYDDGALAEDRAVFEQAGVRYRPDANGWCNTLMMNTYPEPTYTFTLPPGLGISFNLRADMGELKSKYVLIHAGTRSDWPQRFNLKHIGDMPLGKLYVNPAAACSG